MSGHSGIACNLEVDECKDCGFLHWKLTPIGGPHDGVEFDYRLPDENLVSLMTLLAAYAVKKDLIDMPPERT